MKFQGRTATAIIIYPENKILLVKRSTPPFIGYWALPGGRAEHREKVEDTVLREVKEETGLNGKVLRKIGDYHEKGIQDGYEYDYYPTCFLVKPVSGKIERQKSEITEIRLFKFEEIPNDLAFEHKQMIEDYIVQETKKQNDFT